MSWEYIIIFCQTLIKDNTNHHIFCDFYVNTEKEGLTKMSLPFLDQNEAKKLAKQM